MKKLFATFLVALLALNLYGAGVPKNKKKRTLAGLYLTAKEAVEFIKKNRNNTVFVDVRTPVEVEYVGYSYLMDKNIPWHFIDTNVWNPKKHRFADIPKNKHFVYDVAMLLKKKGLGKNANIIVMCRSGHRSAKAANALYKAGFKNVYTIVDGFEGDKDKKYKHRIVNGWKNTTPPETWGYKLVKEKMYQF